MDNFNRAEHLKRVHQNRKAATREKIDYAINKLVTHNEKINFNSVAKEASVSKATLYSYATYRSKIESLRIDHNNQVELSKTRKPVIQKVKTHNQFSQKKNRKLQLENNRPRNDLKMAYGQLYQKNKNPRIKIIHWS